jgi:hypothetical protein
LILMSLSISGLETAIDRLYQLPIAEFTQARNALAAECKAAGDKDGAARVKELTKPSAVAWAVNQLYWRERDRFDALAVAMAELAAAQREALGGGGVAALKDASRRKAEQLQAAARAAARRLVASGAAGGPAVVQRLSATLEAIATPRPPGTTAPTAGRLVAELQPAGFDVALGLGGLELPPVPARPAKGPEPAARRIEAESPSEGERRSERVRLQQAEFEVARLRREASAAERALEQAESRAAAARADVEQFETRLHRARAQAEEKAVAADAARRALAQSRADLAAAEAALAGLERSGR